jgi:hypothetical protein
MGGQIGAFQAGMQAEGALFQAAGSQFAKHQAGEEAKWRQYEARINEWQAYQGIQASNLRADATTAGAASTLLKGAGEFAGALFSPRAASTTTTSSPTMPKDNWYYFG